MNKIYDIKTDIDDMMGCAKRLRVMKDELKDLAAASGETIHFNYHASPSPLGGWPGLLLECSPRFIALAKANIPNIGEPAEARSHPDPSVTMDREENLGKNPKDWRYKKPTVLTKPKNAFRR